MIIETCDSCLQNKPISHVGMAITMRRPVDQSPSYNVVGGPGVDLCYDCKARLIHDLEGCLKTWVEMEEK